MATFTNATLTPITDAGAGNTPSTTTSTIIVSGMDPFLTNLDLQTFITHSFSDDLDITLISPAGTVVVITSDNGGQNDNVFNGTIWDDDADPGGTVPNDKNERLANEHTYVNLTLASPLVPEQGLGVFAGEDPNGTWTISITDDANLDTGVLNSWTLDVTSIAPQTISPAATVTQATPVAILDNNVTTSTIVVSGSGTHLFDVDLTTFIQHTFSNDLDITLTSPAGTVVTITTDNGGVNDNVFNGTTWDDDAAEGAIDHVYVNNVSVPLLRPEEPLSAFFGEDPNGVWTITIADDTAMDVGTLTQWSLAIRTYDSAGAAPTDIALSNANAAENSVNGTIVGALSATDPDAGDTAAFALLDNAGGRFAISGSNLVVASGALLNFETATSHSVKVRVTDGGGLTFDKTFNIGVTDVDEAPTNIALSGDTVVENSANGTVIGALTETDPDTSDTAAFTLVDDAGGRFAISGNDLVVADGSLLDFESNTSHSVTVRATDSGGLTLDKVFNIAVSDIDETIGGTPHWMKNVFNPAHPAGWSPAPIGDFNGDGTSDIAWFNASTGNVDIWKLQDGAWVGSSDVGSHPAGYQLVGSGDLDGDGISDLIWFNPTTRDLDLWKITDGHWAGSVDIGIHPAGYVPSGVGDFNGDGTSDIAWYNASTGDIDIWTIVNGQWAGSSSVGAHPAGYQPSLTGDFNGDGTSDIAWYNPTTGDVDIWKIVNGQWAGSSSVGAHPAGWQPLGAADYNKDGTADIAWYNPTNNNIDVWLMNNGQWSASADIGNHPAGAVAVGVGDFDHNGVSDIMWRDTATGGIDNWLLAVS